ncbi:MAG: glycosyltransferase [Lachnospiraceae bacterium]|nr:glycosyltransferase [Lachnospiraceae bacterium]
MRILYLNTTYFGGGAEQVTRQIYRGMKARGHEVFEIVCYNLRGEIGDPDVHVLYRSVPEKIFHRVQTYNRGNHNLTIPYALHYICNFIRKNQIDAVHLHNPHDSFLGIRDIRTIAGVCPMVWTLHDFWALTGHCASPYGCDDRWIYGCTSCEHLGNYPRLRRDVSAEQYRRKEKYLTGAGIRFTVPSEWMREQVAKSYLRGENCAVICNSLDIAMWNCPDKETIRKEYRLNTKKLVLAFVAADMAKPLKGMQLLADALDLLDSERFLLLTAGDSNREMQGLFERFETVSFGYLREQKKMNEFYALADVLVNPSVYETFGLVNIEAMASGTPVVAFRVCAMSEVVGEEAGWCVPEMTARALAEKLTYLECHREELELKAKCARAYVQKKFGQEHMLDQYEALYRSVLVKNR